MTQISVDHLSAEDADTPPEGLEFIVTPPSNGHLALSSAPSRHILNFTQGHITSGQLVFLHSGEKQLRHGTNRWTQESADAHFILLQARRPVASTSR